MQKLLCIPIVFTIGIGALFLLGRNWASSLDSQSSARTSTSRNSPHSGAEAASGSRSNQRVSRTHAAEIIARLGNEDRVVKAAALEELLAAVAVTPDVAKAVTELLLGADPRVRSLARDTFAHLIEIDSRPFRAIVLGLLAQSDRQRRHEVVDALAKIRTPESKSLIVGLLSESDTRVVLGALRTLGRMSSEAGAAAANQVADTTRHKDAGVRAIAFETLGNISRSPEHLGALESGLDDADARVRRGAVYAAGQFGEVARSLLAVVEQATFDPDHGVRSEAKLQIGNIDRAVALASHRRGISHGDPKIARESMRALASMEPKRADVARDIVSVLAKPADEKTATYAFRALASIGPPAMEAVPVIVDAIRGDGLAADWAAIALAKVDPAHAGQILRDLVAQQGTRSKDARWGAIIGLGLLGDVTIRADLKRATRKPNDGLLRREAKRAWLVLVRLARR